MLFFCITISFLLNFSVVWTTSIHLDPQNSNIIRVTAKDKELLKGRNAVDQLQGIDCLSVSMDLKNVDAHTRGSRCNEANVDNDMFTFYIHQEEAKSFLCCYVTVNVCAPETTTPLLIDSNANSPIKSCSNHGDCGANYFCLATSYANRDEEFNLVPIAVSDKWSHVGACCLRQFEDKSCIGGSWVSDIENTNNECLQTKGRCGNGKGVCGKKNKTLASACCKPQNLCPTKWLPYGFEIGTDSKNNPLIGFESNQVFGNTITKKEWEDKCNDAYVGTAVYLTGNLCCDKGQIKNFQEFEASWFADSYNRLSEKACGNDEDCGDGMWCAKAYNMKDTSLETKMCFKKPTCPHSTKTDLFPVKNGHNSSTYHCDITKLRVKTHEELCGKNLYCMRVDIGKDWKSNAGLCCEAKAYEAVCTIEKANHKLVKDKGIVVPDLNCASVDTAIRLMIELDDGIRGTKNKVCCEYKKNIPFIEKLKKKCPNGGELQFTRDGQDVKWCQEKDVGKREGDTFCRQIGNYTAWCKEDICKSDDESSKNSMLYCSDMACIWNVKGITPDTANKYCELDFKGNRRCCPAKTQCYEGKCNFPPGTIPKNMEPHQIPNLSVRPTHDCGGNGKFCNEKEGICYFVGGIDKTRTNGLTCKSSAEECKDATKLTYHCAFMSTPGMGGTCVTFTKVKEAGKYQLNKKLLFGMIACGALALVSGVTAVIFFLKYRSRNFCGTQKTKKKDKKNKKEDVITGGGTTTGGETPTETTK